MTSLADQFVVSSSRDFEVARIGLARPLFERVENVDRFCELRDVEDPVLDLRTDADFINATADLPQVLEIVRRLAALDRP